MKKFLSGFLAGAIVFGTIGALAVSYVAVPAEFKVLVNGKEFTSDPPALVVEGRTYLPLRAIGDALGIPVNWNDELGQAEVGIQPANETNNDNVLSESGETVVNDKWKMTFLNCKTYNEIDNFIKAGDGKEFVILTFELENISSEKQAFSFVYLGSYFDDYKTSVTVIGSQIDGATQLAANEIEPGKKIKGYLAYEVEPDWKKIDIVYNDDVFSDTDENAIKFTINNVK